MNLTTQYIQRFATVILIALAAMFADAAPTWEKIAAVTSDIVDPSTTDNYDLKVVDGTIILTIMQKTNVKVVTILGQPVAERQLEPGTWRLPISARGIYILKVGSATRRITI